MKIATHTIHISARGIALVAAMCLLTFTVALAQTPHAGHSGQQASQQSKPQTDDRAAGQHDAVNERGDKVMGFSHAKTTHHFRLKADGGAIEVEANDANDAASRAQIRAHLRHIARKFADGDFTAPMMIHAQSPPGVPVMKQRKNAIMYQFEETARGGRVRITTVDAEALAAVHEFLRFQIADHRTGDATEIKKEPK